MSLYRQLWIGVIGLMLLVFAGSFAVNLYSAKSYLEQQLYTQSMDNATSLALSMSQQSKDDATAELLVSALFDSGHFRQVRYTDVHGRIVVDRINPNPPDRVPEWFVQLIDIHAEAGTALVSDGWKQAGRVTVLAHTRFAYQSLWGGAWSLLGWIAAACVALGLLAMLFLNGVRRPLARMVEQARAIVERRFITIEEPRILEVRSAVRAMNIMVERVRAMFNEQAERIRQLHQEANHDSLTGLANRRFFMGGLVQALAEEKHAHGALLIVRLHDLAGLNHHLGREKTDAFLQRCASILVETLRSRHGWLAGRLNGADFAILAPGAGADEIWTLAQGLLAEFATLYRHGYTDDSQSALYGFTLYRHGEPSAAVLARADTALLQAEAAPENIAANLDATSSSQSNIDWQKQLACALDENRFELAYFPVRGKEGGLLHREAVIRLRQSDGELLPAWHFLPHALHLGLMAEIDLRVARLALRQIMQDGGAVAVNLSADSIRSADFRRRLLAEIEAAGARVADRLWLEVNEFGLRDEMEVLAGFAAQVSRLGCKVGIEHFGRHLGNVPKLYELPLHYLKIDGSFVHELDAHPGNQHLIRAMTGIASGLGLLTIAEQVTTEAEWQALLALGIDGGTGPLMS